MDNPSPNIPKLLYIFDSHLQPLSATCYKHTSLLAASHVNIPVSWQPTHQHSCLLAANTSTYCLEAANMTTYQSLPSYSTTNNIKVSTRC